MNRITPGFGRLLPVSLVFTLLLLSGCKTPTTSGGGSTPGTPLKVVSTTPANGSTGVSVYNSVQVVFNEAPDPASVSESSFDTHGIIGTYTVNGKVVTFIPSNPSPLAGTTKYDFTLVPGAAGIHGLADPKQVLESRYDFSFTTSAITDCAETSVLCVDDTPGPEQEYSTIQDAVDNVIAGETILVFNGTYQGFRISRSGSPTARITIKANGNGVLINQREPGGSGNSVLISNASYVTVDGFTVDHMGASGFAFAARNASPSSPMRGLVISNNTVKNAASTNLYLSEVADSVVEGNTTFGSLTSHGIYLANGGSDNTVLRANTSYDNAKAGIHLNGDLSVGGDGLHQNITVEDNIIYNNTGNGLDFDGLQNAVIRNNLVYGNGRHSLRIFKIDAAAGPANIKVINNTFYSGNNGWAIKFSDDAGGNVFFNNILLTRSNSLGAISLDNAHSASDYNIVTGRFSTDNDSSIVGLSTWQANGFGAHSIVSDPSTVFSNPDNNDFDLAPGSPAIDMGVGSYQGSTAPTRDMVGTSRPQGLGYDAGSRELVTP
jgi:hypothetical protein